MDPTLDVILPREIRRLEAAVVNRIAAGEVVQRPANAVKELMENSVDAGATFITITVKEGGIKSIQVQDNGCGIRREDLTLLCERHATSKLRTFEDLSAIGTLGFRGEALASVSYVAHVTVTTMTAEDAQKTQHGWRATYCDGCMDPQSPRPAAATQGTVVLVEDLFYNAPLRRKALKSAADEYASILDVVSRYAVFHAGAAFSVKKSGEVRADLSTMVGATRAEAVRAVYGSAVAKHLLTVKFSCGGPWEDIGKAAPSDMLRCAVDGFVTGADYAGRKTQLVLFINGRSVEFPPLKRCLEATYAALLPKTSKPFAFLDVRLPPADVDVNVHPTKKEVAFLHQEAFVDGLREAIEAALLESNAQRTFKQALLPGAPVPQPMSMHEAAEGQNTYYRPDKLVRTDARTQTLDAFLPGNGRAGADEKQPSILDGNDHAAMMKGRSIETEDQMQHTSVLLNTSQNRETLATVPRRPRASSGVYSAGPSGDFLPTAMEIPPAHDASAVTATIRPLIRHHGNPTQRPDLDSVELLLALAEDDVHDGLAEMLRTATFVGLSDSRRALFQSGTRLYLIDLSVLTRDMFCQQALRRFGQAPRVPLRPAPSIRELALIALLAEEAAGRWTDSTEGGTKEEVAGLLEELLVKKAGLLADCFSIDVDDQGRLSTLPGLIEQYQPSLETLPAFILSLGQDVEWSDERGCFASVAEALAELYRVHGDPALDDSGNGDDIETTDSREVPLLETSNERERKRREWEAAHVLLPALRLFLKPPRARATDGTVVELTRLERLYRVFERC